MEHTVLVLQRVRQSVLTHLSSFQKHSDGVTGLPDPAHPTQCPGEENYESARSQGVFQSQRALQVPVSVR